MRRHTLLAAALGCFVLLTAAPRAQVARHLAAPPSDILSGLVVLPEPAALEVASTGAVLELSWQRAGGEWVAALDLPVERAGPLSLGLLGVSAESWTWELAAPGGELRDAASWAADAGSRRVVETLAADDPRHAVGLALGAADAGSWRVRVRTPAASGAAAGDAPSSAWLAVRTAGGADVVLRSHLGTTALLSDRAFSVVASLEGAAGARADGFGEARIESAAGRWTQPLLDDGLHDDGAPGDGVAGAWIGPLPPGATRVAVVMSGRAPSGAAGGAAGGAVGRAAGGATGGAAFVRSVQHAFVIEEPAVRLGGWANAAPLDDQRLDIEIALQPLTALRRLHLSAEVWGPDAQGTAVPVAWLSTIGLPEETWGTTSLHLHLDGRWLARAGTRGPLELRRVRVQDPDSHVPFDELAALSLPSNALPANALPASGLQAAGAITPAMLLGAPLPGAPAVTIGASPGLLTDFTSSVLLDFTWQRALMLSHGYCSNGSIWPAADFSSPKLEFLDPNANRSNDAFAQLLAAAGAGKDSFGFVGHSQGGLAALHLLTYYNSGLDYAIGPRRIQSLASPYQGTPLASLGFFACGVNNDMTTSGAPMWLAGIPSWARGEVFYWTTQNSGSACSFFTNLVLGSPNDGTVERARCQLPGAHSMGHVAGWCHTTGMSNPASYTDHVRNQEMNAEAAR